MEWFKRTIESLTQEEYEQCLKWMDPARREQVLNRTLEESRRATVLGEWMVKTTLADRCGVPLEKIKLFRTPKGKPYAEDLPLQFSISHTDGWVAVAFHEQPIGIDIERVRPIRQGVPRRVCTPRELALLEQTPPEEQTTRFFELWTAKEAYFKCIGTGITDLQAISVADLKPQQFLQGDCVISVITNENIPLKGMKK